MILLLLLACTGGPTDKGVCDVSTWYADADGDGFGDVTAATDACEVPDGYVAEEGDCDDASAATSPVAAEQCDGVDEDCDGVVDDGATDALEWYPDADGDGFGDDAATETLACTPPDGAVADATDCDDTAAGVYPGAPEVCDDVDDDCNGVAEQGEAVTWYPDADDDGYGVAEGAVASCTEPAGFASDPTDCDDAAAEVNPGAAEVCGNGIDDDCSGDEGACEIPTGDVDLGTEFDAVYEGIAEGYAGCGVAFAGDYDGDGYGDMLIGDYTLNNDAGGVYVVSGLASGSYNLSADATALLQSSDSHAKSGERVSGAGDFDGDGLADVLVGAYSEGTAYVMTGAPTGLHSLDDSALVMTTGGSIRGLARLGDVDGDGNDDVAVGDYLANGVAGEAYLVLGGRTGELDLADADGVYSGELEVDAAGVRLSPAGDLDGDGIEELLVGACNEDTGADRAGATYVVMQPSLGASSLGDAQAKLTGLEEGGWACVAGRGGDIDGDGRDDLVLAAYAETGLATYSGVVYAWFAAPTGVASVSTADATWLGVGDADLVSDVAGGDVNGDGVSDLLVGAKGLDGSALDGGGAYLVYGPFSAGTFDFGSADTRFLGPTEGDYAGAAVALGDQDADGFADVLIGAPHNTVDPGHAYMVRGGPGM